MLVRVEGRVHNILAKQPSGENFFLLLPYRYSYSNQPEKNQGRKRPRTGVVTYVCLGQKKDIEYGVRGKYKRTSEEEEKMEGESLGRQKIISTELMLEGEALVNSRIRSTELERRNADRKIYRIAIE